MPNLLTKRKEISKGRSSGVYFVTTGFFAPRKIIAQKDGRKNREGIATQYLPED
jgi:hypothetical protein